MEKDALTIALYDVLAEYADEVKRTYIDKLKEDDHEASGQLFRTMEWKIDNRGHLYVVSLKLQEYWKWIEYGRKPGKFPPLNRLREWVRVKPVIPERDANGKLPTIKQLAFLIGRKIKEKGIKPTPDLQATLNEVNGKYLDRIREAFNKATNEEFARIMEILA